MLRQCSLALRGFSPEWYRSDGVSSAHCFYSYLPSSQDVHRVCACWHVVSPALLFSCRMTVNWFIALTTRQGLLKICVLFCHILTKCIQHSIVSSKCLCNYKQDIFLVFKTWFCCSVRKLPDQRKVSFFLTWWMCILDFLWIFHVYYVHLHVLPPTTLLCWVGLPLAIQNICRCACMCSISHVISQIVFLYFRYSV